MRKTYYYKTKLAKKMGIFRYEKNRTRSHDTWVSIFGSLLPATILPRY